MTRSCRIAILLPTGVTVERALRSDLRFVAGRPVVSVLIAGHWLAVTNDSGSVLAPGVIWRLTRAAEQVWSDYQLSSRAA